MHLKINVIERECKNLEFGGEVNKDEKSKLCFEDCVAVQNDFLYEYGGSIPYNIVILHSPYYYIY
jgi:hypothetical protein